MDGVTDAPFRWVVDELSKGVGPSVMFTEFVPVEAIKADAERVLDAFVTHETDTPLVAQLYGTDLDAYYLATIVVCELGFDGVDINMGCPARSVHSRGAGAGLIKTPDLAVSIIQRVRQATQDYAGHPDASYFHVPQKILDRIKKIKVRHAKQGSTIPVSIKTRIGFEKNEVERWIPYIAGAKPDCITLHGRTLMQMYRGMADWDAIKMARDIVKDKSQDTIFLGNGDIKCIDDARELIERMSLDGALVGRAVLGNPWFFRDDKESTHTHVEITNAMLLHARKLLDFFPDKNFISLRKHMLWYADRSPMLKKYKELIQKINNIEDIERIVREQS